MGGEGGEGGEGGKVGLKETRRGEVGSRVERGRGGASRVEGRGRKGTRWGQPGSREGAKVGLQV